MYKFILLTVVASCIALPTEDTSEKRVTDCAKGVLNPACLKLGAIVLIERLNKKDEVSLFPGVSLVRDISDKKDTAAAEFARSFEKDDKLDKSLLYHVGNFLDTHSVKLRLVDDSAVKEATEVMGEGRAKSGMGGKKGGMGGLIAMAMMMKDTSIVLSLMVYCCRGTLQIITPYLCCRRGLFVQSTIWGLRYREINLMTELCQNIYENLLDTHKNINLLSENSDKHNLNPKNKYKLTVSITRQHKTTVK